MQVNILDSNSIYDLPPIGEPIKSTFHEEKEIKKAKAEAKQHKEADFRRWLIKNKPPEAIMIPIETSTATGVPDIFACYNGCNCWIECKIASTRNKATIRGTQYAFFKKLIANGGTGRLAVQRFSSHHNIENQVVGVDIYDAADIVALPLSQFTQYGGGIGPSLFIPYSLEPMARWDVPRAGQGNGRRKNKADAKELEYLYSNLLLDRTKCEC